MGDGIKVTVSSYGPNRPLMLRWTDPETGQRKAESSGTYNREKAERKAAILEKELRDGSRTKASRMPWEDFALRYAAEVLPGLAQKTRNQVSTVFKTVERICSPRRLAEVNPARLSGVAAQLRAEGKSEITIRNYLAHLKAALRWAVDLGMLPALPKFPKVQRAKRGKAMKGRPITGEEFDRMLGAVAKVLSGQDRKQEKGQQPKRKTAKPRKRQHSEREAVESWQAYLRGLWWSGLRLRESLELSWDQRAGLSVDLSGKFPMLRIRGDSQKSGKDQLYPIAPEFAGLLLAVPENERHGRVFKPLGAVNPNGGPSAGGPVCDPDYVSHVVSRIGEAAGVKVDVKMKTKRDRKTGQLTRAEVVKYASAHDLRRSFGFRWSRRIMPPELRELMRHADIATTMEYYVGMDAQTTAESLWAAFSKATGNNLATIGQTQPTGAIQETTQALGSQGLSEYTPQDSNL